VRKEMEELLQTRPEILITVVGIGGCGCNTVNMLHENNLSNSVNLLAVNTDLATLNYIDVENKILIGENLTNGYGAGADPAVGLKAAEESEEAIENALKDSDVVVITAGFGGGTGTGASPLVAKVARELGISCIAIVTLPFESEGKMRMDYALQGLGDIKEPAQAFITLSNDLLLKGLGDSIGLFSAFKQSNDVLKNLVSALVQMFTQTGFINVDKNDFSRILSYEGESILGVGKAESEEQYLEALDQALNNPLVSIAKIDTAKGIIIQIVCREEIQLATYDGIPRQIRSKLANESALIVVGVTLDPLLDSALEILLIASGISSEEKQVTKKNKAVAAPYLNDDLTFIRNEAEQIDGNGDHKLTNNDYTDIPAITRKLLETQRLKDLDHIKDII
jgi:cell division protein FtsZ